MSSLVFRSRLACDPATAWRDATTLSRINEELSPWMRVRLTELDPEARRFVEQSQLLSLRAWRHERWIESLPGGCALNDRLDPAAHVRLLDPVVRAFVRRLFRTRHAVLRQRYGELP